MRAEQPTGRSRLKSVLTVSSGNFLEMYDFMVFGYYAKAIGKAFFPTTDPAASLLLAFMTFGAGFLMRPVGAIVLGSYIDRHGRRKGLLLTLALMGLGTLTIAAMPTYATLGIAAPLLVLAGRLVQGLSAGVEVGGASVYLSEVATEGNRGFYVAWQSASQQLAVIFAALVGLLLNSWLPAGAMDAWGWRIPFLVGSLLLPFLLIMRRALAETHAFEQRTSRPSPAALLQSMVSHLRLVLLGMAMAVTTTVFFYMLTAYTPTYGTSVLGLTPAQSMLVTLVVGLTNFVLLPTMGALSDRIGRQPQLLVCAVLAILIGYPALQWMVAAPSLGRLIAVDVVLAVIYAGYNGALVVHLTEIMPAHLRTTGFALAYSLATAIFGGFTPALATFLIDATGDKAAPGIWLMCAGLISLLAVLLSRSDSRRAALAASTL
ncbi:tricarballylate/proton symporter TcuC [Novosphingobium aerophilum]|uniref:Tricarballylate/proton symporter TcuC n=1 Tax=Novosphingobium aerophilum TaxID=2839843 RepID=A0A7X1KDV7_9SPHN|nr:tricarballylate/proton symporter TcuC [Novosphingobium aerophilum]MBC2653557.1 tricarballylate/proton symporter TcuC [Novosphingobium aerophilum]